jgi:hypothetical protein
VKLRLIAIAAAAGIAALGLVNTVSGNSSAADSATVAMKLKAKHGSRISGTATLTPAGTGVRVVLRLRGRVKRVHPAHIHTGLCRREPTFANPRIASGLNNVVRGKSVTKVPSTDLSSLQAKPHSINVHDPNTLGVVACGDIPRA